MSAQGTPSVPPGWYPDPEQPSRGRYWDGTAWTENFHDPAQGFAPQPELKAPAGTDWNTTWIWLIVGIQILPLVTLALVPWGSVYDFDVNDPSSAAYSSLAVFASPFYWLSLLLGWAIYGLTVFFAYRDVKELTSRGVPKPFHWAFAFIGAIVYVIGRSIVVKRRTGAGYAPIWAEVAYVVLSFVLSGVILVMMLSGLTETLSEISYR